MDLLKIYKKILDKKSKTPPVHVIKKAAYSVKEMGSLICKKILHSFEQKSSCNFTELVQQFETKADRVLCFVVLLELSKFQYVHLIQEDHLSSVDILPTFYEVPQLQEFDNIDVDDQRMNKHQLRHPNRSSYNCTFPFVITTTIILPILNLSLHRDMSDNIIHFQQDRSNFFKQDKTIDDQIDGIIEALLLAAERPVTSTKY